MGLLLRFFFVTPIALNYKFILHAHSHTALLGWIYLGLTTLIYKLFLSEAQNLKIYKSIFLFTNICIVGMLLTFPIQGYALFSIIFSTLFLFASYWFSGFALMYVPQQFKNRFSWKLVKTALLYLIISSIGPWAIGGVMATLGPESIWYKTSIYFYLHFQYNGWFILTLLGVLFYIFEENGIVFNTHKLKSFFLLLNFGILFTFFLSVLWITPPIIFYIFGLMGAVAQGLAFYELYFLLKQQFPILKKLFSSPAFSLLKIAGILMIIKLLVQLFSAIPYVADLAYRLKDFIIGYLHMVFLGIVITSLLVFLKYFKLVVLPRYFLPLYFFAFATTEFLIFYKAFAFWLKLPFFSLYYTLLAVFSFAFPMAVALLLFKNIFIQKR